MSVEPTAPTTAPTAADRAASDSTPLVPTDAEHVTTSEIVEFLRDLAEHRRGASDPSERAAFLARKAVLLGRITADPTIPAAPAAPAAPAPERRTP